MHSCSPRVFGGGLTLVWAALRSPVCTQQIHLSSRRIFKTPFLMTQTDLLASPVKRKGLDLRDGCTFGAHPQPAFIPSPGSLWVRHTHTTQRTQSVPSLVFQTQSIAGCRSFSFSPKQQHTLETLCQPAHLTLGNCHMAFCTLNRGIGGFLSAALQVESYNRCT